MYLRRVRTTGLLLLSNRLQRIYGWWRFCIDRMMPSDRTQVHASTNAAQGRASSVGQGVAGSDYGVRHD